MNSALLRIKACLILLLTEEFSSVVGVRQFSFPELLNFSSQFNDVEMVFELDGLHWGAVDIGYDTT